MMHTIKTQKIKWKEQKNCSNIQIGIHNAKLYIMITMELTNAVVSVNEINLKEKKYMMRYIIL